MKDNDVKIGMKVVPHSKTVLNSCNLDDCQLWKNARRNKQPYLFVVNK